MAMNIVFVPNLLRPMQTLLLKTQSFASPVAPMSLPRQCRRASRHLVNAIVLPFIYLFLLDLLSIFHEE
jgi:hypothetical protein